MLASALAAVPLGAAQAQAGIEVGVLTCSVVPGSRLNLLVRSTADVKCVYSKGGETEEYVGETGIALGLDLSFKQDEKMAFTVIAASQDVRPGAKALTGKYVGAEASAAAGLGLGAKALVGGGAKNIGLQPLAIESSTGLGASAGLSFLYIEPAQ
jgi:hypothetical protein